MAHPAEIFLIALRAADAGLRETADASATGAAEQYMKEALITGLDRLRIACVRYRASQEFKDATAFLPHFARPILSDPAVRKTLETISDQLDAFKHIGGAGIARAAATIRKWVSGQTPETATTVETQMQTLIRILKKNYRVAA